MMMKHNKSYLSTICTGFFVCFLLAIGISSAWSQEKEKSKKLPTIAVVKPDAREKIKPVVNEMAGPVKLLSSLEQGIQRLRKFRVLTRDKKKLREIEAEQDRAQSDEAKGNAAKEGRLANAEYIVTPVVEDFMLCREKYSVPNINGKYNQFDKGWMVVNVEVLDTTSGAIKGTFTIRSAIQTDKKVVSHQEKGEPDPNLVTNMYEEITARFVERLMSTVFPMKVMQAKSGNVYINRGRTGDFEKGDTLNLYKPGETMRDPDTGKVLGTTEVQVGKVRVKRVTPKFSIAKVIDQNNDTSIKKGFLLRRPGSGTTQDEKPEPCPDWQKKVDRIRKNAQN